MAARHKAQRSFKIARRRADRAQGKTLLSEGIEDWEDDVWRTWEEERALAQEIEDSYDFDYEAEVEHARARWADYPLPGDEDAYPYDEDEDYYFGERCDEWYDPYYHSQSWS